MEVTDTPANCPLIPADFDRTIKAEVGDPVNSHPCLATGLTGACTQSSRARSSAASATEGSMGAAAERRGPVVSGVGRNGAGSEAMSATYSGSH